MRGSVPSKASFNLRLVCSTALIGSVAMVPCGFAHAADVVISTPVTTQPTLNNGDTLTVTSSGSITTVGENIYVNFQLLSLRNDGSMISTGGSAPIILETGGNITGGLVNTGLISGNAGIGIDISGTANGISGGLVNSGTIQGVGNRGIYLGASSNFISGGLMNSGTITGTSAIYLDPGAYINGGIINSSGGTITGTAGSGIYLTNASISAGISNGGTISGSSSGIEMGSNSTLGNITNSGLLSGAYGIRLSGGGTTVTNNITNSGTIDGTTSAISISTNASIGGGITNSGTITSANNAIDVAGSTISGAIANSGTISGVTGINLTGISAINGGVTNSGTISGSGASGINIANNSTVNGGITNTGQITSVGNAIDVAGTINGTIANSGTISGTSGINLTSATLNGITSSGTIFHTDYGIFIDVGATSGAITNSGNITSTGSGVICNSGCSGIYVLGNTSTITNSGVITVASQAIQIANTANIAQITNSGTLSGDLVGINYFGAGSTDIANSGTIGSRSVGASSAGIIVNTGAVLGSINNSGTISGNTGILFLNASSVGGGITNSGTIRGIGGTAIDFTNINALSPLTLNGGRVIGNITDPNSFAGNTPVTIAGDFTTEGDITVSTLAVNNGTTFTISAGDNMALNQMIASPGGIYQFGLNNSSAGGFGFISTDTVVLTGSTVKVLYDGGTIADGDEMRIAAGSLPIIGGPGSTLTAVQDNSALWNFRIADGTAASTPTTANDLYLFVSKNNNVSYTTSSNAAASTNLQNLSGTTNPQLQLVLASLNSAPSETALNNVAQSTQPGVDGGVVITTNNFSDKSMELTNIRLASLTEDGQSGVASGNSGYGRNAWAQVFGQSVTQGMRNNINGYDASTGGIALGLDTENYLDGMVLGAAFSYGASDIKSKNANNTNTSVNNYQITLYGDYVLDERQYVRGQLAYAYSMADTTRHNVGGVGGLTARGDFDASQYGIRMETGRHYRHGDYRITPSVFSNYLYYSPDDYTETGAGGASLSVNQKNVQSLEAGIGISVETDYQLEDGTLTPELHGGYRYAVINDAVEATSRFTGGGTAIASSGADPARSRLNLGLGVTYELDDTTELKANYDYDFRSDYQASAAYLQASVRF